MPFNSESAVLGGQKSKRGKSLSQEIKYQLTNVAEDLIKAIEITSLNDRDKIAYLKAIMPFIMPKNESINFNQMSTEFQIEIIK
jgi:hypothetical protein